MFRWEETKDDRGGPYSWTRPCSRRKRAAWGAVGSVDPAGAGARLKHRIRVTRTEVANCQVT